MFDDSLTKVVRIPIRVVNGKVKYYYGGELPDIVDGAIGELYLPEHNIKDQKFINISQMEDEVVLFPTNTTLMISVSNSSIPEDKRGYLKNINTKAITTDVFVEIKLFQPLKMQIRGSKKSILKDVNCIIPCLGKAAFSINSAYTMVSEVFEPHRSSHTGNVFDKCFYKEDNYWYALKIKRQIEEVKNEGKFFLDQRTYQLNNTTQYVYNELDNSEELLVHYLHEFESVTGEKVKQLFNNNIEKYLPAVNGLIDKEIIEEVKGIGNIW